MSGKSSTPTFARLTLYYADRRRVPAKLRALIDFLRHRRQSSRRKRQAP
ncbi:hypothetical protein [Rhizobium sp. BR 362]